VTNTSLAKLRASWYVSYRTMTVTAIVPAYNEAARLGRVLDVLTTYPGFAEVIVIDDGSYDTTSAVAGRYPVCLIKHTHNVGKGQAMDEGVHAAQGDIIFFCDADVTGLTHHILDRIIQPVQHGEVDMFIGMRNRKIYFLRFLLRFIPLLGGERALTRKLWQQVPSIYKDRFSPEVALNFVAQHLGHPCTYAVFPGLGQTIKERKYGLLPGLQARFSMIGDFIRAEVSLRRRYALIRRRTILPA
jgi:glycosyltransferase involved in cell wall biosynthesis